MKDFVFFTISKIEDLRQEQLKTETDFAKSLLEKMLLYLNLEFSEIVYSENGKPFFKYSDIFFNYSHSKKYIACAISKSEVGIDIEERGRKIKDKIALRFLENEEDMERRLEKWVKKEAFSKMKGLGFQIGFKDLILEEIIEKNIFLDREEYIASVFSQNPNAIFKELIFNGEFYG